MEIHGEINKNQIRQAATRAGDQSGDHFTTAMGKRLRLFAEGEGFTSINRDSGRRAGVGFMVGFSDWVTRPNRGLLMAMRTGIPAILASPAGIAGGTIGLVFIASFVSAVIGSAALGLVGAGLLGLGVFGVRGSEQVKESWKGTLASIDAGLTDAAQSLVGPFANAADQVGEAFATRIAPRLKSIFADLAPAVGPLVDGLVGMVDSFLAKIEPGAGRLSDFLSKMGAQLPRLGEAAGQFIDTLLDHGPDIARAFEGVVTIVVRLLDALEDIIVVGVNVFNFFVSLDDWIRNSPLWTFFGPGGLIGGIIRGLDLFGSGGEKALMKTNDAGLELGPTLLGLGESTDIAGLSMEEAAEKAGGLSAALGILNGDILSGREAERNYQAAIDDATQSVKDNGATLDINTEAGRANQAALDAVVTAAMAAADAEFALSGDVHAATEKLLLGREAAVKIGIAMGLSRQDAEDLADELLDVPKLVETKFKNNAKLQESAVADYIRRINNLPKGKTVTITTKYVNQFITETFGVNAPTVERFGGIHHAQQGLLSTSRMFGRSNRTLFAFNEPETGGEAFIARNAPRERSLAIGAEAMRWHRAVVVPMERAATTMAAGAGAGPTRTERPVNNVNVRVFVGDRELTDIVRVEIEDHDQAMVSDIRNGVGSLR